MEGHVGLAAGGEVRTQFSSAVRQWRRRSALAPGIEYIFLGAAATEDSPGYKPAPRLNTALATTQHT